MTQATTTFLTLVNKAIDESGSELATFTGADFTTNTDPQMNRFKGWVVRAWNDIQQESFDWQWMSEQGIVTAKPGIMFYSDTAVGPGTGFINPAVILDVDNTVMQSNLLAGDVRSLTIKYQTPKPFGAMSLQYADYSLTNSHRLDFGLKAGGQMITRAGLNKFVFRAVVPSNVVAAATLAVGQVVNSLTITDVIHAGSTVFTLVNGKVSAYSITGNYAVIDVQYDSSSGDPWAKMRQYALAQSGTTFSIGFSMAIVTASGTVNIGSTIQYPETPAGPPFALAAPMAAITPLNYKIELDGNINGGTLSLVPGDTVTQWQYNIQRSGNIVSYVIPCSMNVDAIYNDPSVGLLKLTVNDDACVGDTNIFVTGQPADDRGNFCMSLFTWLLFTDCVALHGNFLAAVTEKNDANGNPLFATFVIMNVSGTQVTTWSYSLVIPYVIKNWIHSWKSYDWNEEFDADDFIAGTNIREINQSSYKIVYHDDPGNAGEVDLKFVPWSTFNDLYSYATTVPGTPRIVTEDNMGRWRFYPPLDRPYTILFDYVREPLALVNATDVPRGLPQEYVDMIMWKALIYYGEYDEDTSVVGRATKNYMNLLTRFAQQTRPKFYFKSGFRGI